MKWTVDVVVFTVIPGFDKQSGRKSSVTEVEGTWRCKTGSPQTKPVLGPTLNLAIKKNEFDDLGKRCRSYDERLSDKTTLLTSNHDFPGGMEIISINDPSIVWNRCEPTTFWWRNVVGRRLWRVG